MLGACGKALWEMFSEPSLTLNRLEGRIQVLYQKVQHDPGTWRQGVHSPWTRVVEWSPEVFAQHHGFQCFKFIFLGKESLEKNMHFAFNTVTTTCCALAHPFFVRCLDSEDIYIHEP